MNDCSDYTIAADDYRLAAWGAGIAASVRNVCTFKVQTGVQILEASGFCPEHSEPSQLPSPVIRQSIPALPLWDIEQFWRGFQSTKMHRRLPDATAK